MRLRFGWVSLLLLPWLCLPAEAGEKLASAPIFGDNMVLQRDMKVPVWGTAAPGEKVTVSFAGQTVAAAADEKGNWKAVLEPMKAGGPFELTVAGSSTLTFKNVLVGEVWFASGQSNMQTMLAYERDPASDPPEAWNPAVGLGGKPQGAAVKEIAAADHPQIRLRNRVWGGKWEACTPESAKSFSGLAYFFGRDLHEALKVPIGLVAIVQGGSPIETFMSRESIVEAATSDKKGGIKSAGGCWADIEKLVPYAVAGAIWYQGEGGSGVNRYDLTFEVMVKDWRTRWGRDDLPFLFVQLSGPAKGMKPPPAGSVGRLDGVHYLQFQCLKVPGTGLVTAADYEVSRDGIAGHPRNRRELGRRMALLARSMVYGDKAAVGTPLPESMTVQGNKVLLKFRHAGQGLKAKGNDRGEVFGFAVGGDRGGAWASAKVVAPDTVELLCDKAGPVKNVQYLPCFTEGALVNSADVPAPAFVVDEKWFAEQAERDKAPKEKK